MNNPEVETSNDVDNNLQQEHDDDNNSDIINNNDYETGNSIEYEINDEVFHKDKQDIMQPHAQEDDAADNLMIDEKDVQPTRCSKRIANRKQSSRVDNYTLKIYTTHTTNDIQIKDALEAKTKEIKQMVDKKVWTYVNLSDLTHEQRAKIIRSHIFVRIKNDALNQYLKTKARLVGGGDMQDKSIYNNISSPTIAIETVFMMVSIAASERRFIYTVDITGAYLNCNLPKSDEVLMRLDKVTAAILLTIDPSKKQYLRSNGTMIVKLEKALYGLLQSAKLWYERLKDVLINVLDFIVNDYDLCSFNKIVDGVQITIGFHVDDLMMTCVLEYVIINVISTLQREFEGITVTKGDKHSYLGMQISIYKDWYTIDMMGYLDKILTARGTDKYTNYPASQDLMETYEEESEMLEESEQKSFHSDVAKILFIAKRTKLAILPAISFLASRVNKANKKDKSKLDKIFAYLNETKYELIKYKCNSKVELSSFIDASWATHEDCKGRSGIILMMAGAAVGGWSYKQKMVTRNSTESEIVALTDGLSEVVWAKKWLGGQGYSMRPIKVYQDNEAVIKLIASERRTHQRTKHIDARYFYARELEEEGEIVLV